MTRRVDCPRRASCARYFFSARYRMTPSMSPYVTQETASLPLGMVRSLS